MSLVKVLYLFIKECTIASLICKKGKKDISGLYQKFIKRGLNNGNKNAFYL